MGTAAIRLVDKEDHGGFSPRVSLRVYLSQGVVGEGSVSAVLPRVQSGGSMADEAMSAKLSKYTLAHEQCQHEHENVSRDVQIDLLDSIGTVTGYCRRVRKS